MRTSFSVLALSAAILFSSPLAGGMAVAGVPLVMVQQDAARGQSSQAGTAPDAIDRSVPITGGEVKCLNGKAKGYDCRNVDLVAFLPAAALGAEEFFMYGDIVVRLAGMWGWTDSATGREFLVVGMVGATSFIEVSDPANPRYLGILPRPPGTVPTTRDVKVYKNHAFITAFIGGPNGVQVFDLTQLLHVKNTPAVFTESARYDSVASIHTLALNPATGYAYAGYANVCGGLFMLDVRNPTQPAAAGCYVDPAVGPIHETACFVYHGPDQRYTGRELCFNAHEGRGISIADVTDKQHPTTLSTATYPNIAYAHQGWLSEDQRYFFLDDELDELSGNIPKTRTLVFDVSKLDEPVLTTEFFATTAATDHNLYIRGQHLYQCNDQAGFRVLDVADPRHSQEVGYFDTYPDHGEDAAGLAGARDVYAYFKQEGLVAVNDISDGLFLLRVHAP